MCRSPRAELVAGCRRPGGRSTGGVWRAPCRECASRNRHRLNPAQLNSLRQRNNAPGAPTRSGCHRGAAAAKRRTSRHQGLTPRVEGVRRICQAGWRCRGLGQRLRGLVRPGQSSVTMWRVVDDPTLLVNVRVRQALPPAAPWLCRRRFRSHRCRFSSCSARRISTSWRS
jgi:hypothetical protein